MAHGTVHFSKMNGQHHDQMPALKELAELQKILEFRDAVLAGKHPRFNIRPTDLGTRDALPQLFPTASILPSFNDAARAIPTTDQHRAKGLNKAQAALEKEQEPSVAEYSTSILPISKISSSEINPILLGKSDDLIRAEIRLQRQRLERLLRDQVDQRRVSLKAALQSQESLPDFDLSDVLFKALSIIHPSTAVEVEPSVGLRTSSDSFDENTFYSSQHDTPEQNRASAPVDSSVVIVANSPAPEAMVSHDARGITLPSFIDGAMGTAVAPVPYAPNLQQTPSMTPSALLPQKTQSSHTSHIPGLDSRTFQAIPNGSRVDIISHDLHDNQDHSSLSRLAENIVAETSKSSEGLIDTRVEHAIPYESSTLVQLPFPHVIAHELSPVATQPARVSPLITSKSGQFSGRSVNAEDAAAPAPIAVLRNPAVISSPESSPRAAKAPDKKKSKKKKTRKSSGKGSAVDSPEAPYIKPEPRSPSPLTAAPLPRPHKRQKPNFQQDGGLDYDEPRFDQSSQPVYDSREIQTGAEHGRVRNDRGPVSHQPHLLSNPPTPRTELHHRRPVSTEFRRVYDSERQVLRPPSPRTHEVARSVSYRIIDQNRDDELREYRETFPPPRPIILDRVRSRSPLPHEGRSPLSMRPPTRITPRKILLDEYGRPYYASTTPVVPTRQLLTPLPRYADEDAFYERAPSRAMLRAPVDTFDDGTRIYRTSSPSVLLPRRVATQPEKHMEYRPYQQREYSLRPGPALPVEDEYERSKPLVERRRPDLAQEAIQRDYISRLGSVRPETLGYEPARDHMGRVVSVRPETANGQYGAAARADPYREVAVQRGREYSIRPEIRDEAPLSRIREYSMRPLEQESSQARYTSARPTARRYVDDVEYVDRARALREVRRPGYVDDSQQDIMYE